ncbi:MAG: NADH-quinone oxidoreductase subunit M, partial [Thermofilum sp.]
WYVAVAAALVVGVGLSTAYAFLTMRRVFYGPLRVENAREAARGLWAPLAVLAALGILSFIAASPLVDPTVRVIAAVLGG